VSSLKIVGRVVAGLVITCVVVAVAGAAYQALSLRHYRTVAGVPGKIYDVNGYAMHLYCMGQGSPTVLLDAGLGDDVTIWAKVQPELAKGTRVCAYDRAGFGWSEARPEVQDANAVTGELHGLIEKAGVERPFILMGHSIAGIYLRSYAAKYSGDLAGLVFVDGATPLQDDRVLHALVEIQNQQRREMPREKLLMLLGWYRVRGMCTDVPAGFESVGAWIKADSCVPAQIDATENELDAERASGEETVHAGPFGALPILILSRDPNVLPSNWPVDVAKANAVVWNEMQEEAKGLSSNSRRIIAKGSDHYVQVDRAELVNREVAAFLLRVRAHETDVARNHTTVIE
jgi:pimeloyl-ACP methyl ester carboxylesterase